MSNYIIEGGKKLQGESYVSGSKNASLPILAASVLSGKPVKLYNVPDIHDIRLTLEILRQLGCTVKRNKNKLLIDSSKMSAVEIPDKLMRELRSSVILAGAILGRFQQAVFSYPGGCDIGSRPIDLHLEGFKKLGIHIEEEAGYIKCYADEIIGNEVHLDFPSVGATENLMLASVYTNGITTIYNAAMEPEIEDLQNFLNRMGAKVQGAGTNTIRITGAKELKAVNYNIMPDRIEAGTLLCMTAATGGDIFLKNVIPEHIVPITNKLEECGCKLEIGENNILLEAKGRLRATEIKTMPYPGFPTDMQSIFGAMLSTAKGSSVMIETIFENRFKYMNELKRLGAKIMIEGKIAVIKGVKKLSGTEVSATDLRGGAALVLAGLTAKGETTVMHIEHVLRGYENLDKKLIGLGARIKRG